jgi:hypothetical protein
MEEKIDLLSRARGMLNPIEWEEPFGMVMIEAMALGCPVVAFARGAAPEIIVHRKTGFLVQNVAEMVQFIPRIGELDRTVVRAHVERNFSAQAMAQKYVKLYKKVITAFARPLAAVAVSAQPLPLTASLKTQKSLITPPPLIVKKEGPVRLPSQAPLGSKATLEAEPKP